jgi:hypothetical protein
MSSQPPTPDRKARLFQFAANLEQRRRAAAHSGGTPAAPAMASLREQLEKLPDAEIDSFLAEKFAWVPSEESIADSETTRAAEEVAALGGFFAPADLLAALRIDPMESARLVLNRLAPFCSVESQKDRTVWLLRSDRRSDALRRIVSEGRLSQSLAQTLPPTDPQGDMLRTVLRAQTLNIETLDRAGLLALAWALESLFAIDLPKPDLARVRQRLNSASFLNDYDVLLEKGFFGREPELAQLDAFLKSPGAERRLLTMSGLGGAGKSTLLAKFVHDVMAAQSATVALLDFDRPGVDAQDTISLDMELNRQVSVQFPQGDNKLREARERVRRMVGEELQYRREQSSSAHYQSERGSHYDLLASVGDVISGSNLPLLLILDTFEEAAQRDLSGSILEWLANVESILFPTPLRVIVSGRMFERTAGVFRGHSVSEVTVGEFSSPTAAEYLAALGIPSATAARLSESNVLPRRPLELRLLARLFASNAALSIEELEAELRSGGPAAQVLFAGLVYRRVLQRISVVDDGEDNFGLTDQELQKIAYPGLILRYVNTELILDVLVPTLDLPAFTLEKASRALELLTRHEWLSSVQNGDVWHRRDLRRSVLKPMIGEDPERAARIHERAIGHFRSSPAKSVRAEAVYHGLMLVGPQGNPAQLTIETILEAAQYFEADRTDLPPAGSTLLTLAQTTDVALEDIPLLPPAFRSAIYDSKGTTLVASREFGTALRLYVPTTSPIAPWEQTLLCATAEWDKLRERRLMAGRSWREMGSYLFAAALERSMTLDQAEAEFLQHGMGDVPAPSGAAAELEYLCVGIILIADGRPLPEYICNSLQILHRRYKTFAEIEVTLAKRFLLLWMASMSPETDPLPIAPSTICLHPEWLETAADNFARIASGPVDPSLTAQVRSAISGPSDTNRTSKWLLNYVEHLKPASLVYVDWPNADADALKWYLRGPNAEFRDPARYALLETFPDTSSYADLAGIFQAEIPFALSDLNVAGFTAILSADPERGLESWVELADRAGVLEEVLAKADSMRPNQKKLPAVLSALRRWRAAVDATVSSFSVSKPKRKLHGQ